MKTKDLTNKPRSKEQKMRINRALLGDAVRAVVASSVSDEEVLRALEKRGIPHHKLLPTDPDTYLLGEIKVGDKVSVTGEGMSAVVTKVLDDGTLDLTFEDGDQGFYSAAEVKKLVS